MNKPHGGQVRWTTTHGDTVTVYREKRWIPVDDDAEFEAKHAWRYRVQARNHEIGDIASEAYTRRYSAVQAAKRHHPVIEA